MGDQGAIVVEIASAKLIKTLCELDSVEKLGVQALGPGGVDLWVFPQREWCEFEDLSQFEGWISRDELLKAQRFRVIRDQRTFLATRILVRAVLSRYEAIAPSDWQFATGRYGKPKLAEPSVVPPLYFNLSRTRGMIVCAVSRTYELLGVDVERWDQGAENLVIADRYFAPSELAALKALPDQDQAARFMMLWTLKESYLKAMGVGLTRPLQTFAITIEDNSRADDPIRIWFAPGFEDDPAAWRFALVEVAPEYLVALAVATGGEPFRLRAQRVTSRDLEIA
ncbi:4'-phosphopantetheinyl transferase family protein [Tautonia marina]|uniref:4'-phosphopantetheinyl transferase family protein n=1 Tax=Tautonia marina TaxID=2653855 RepID=UPI0012611ED1|nr:4'-phosphopantetheinyl transferase superfamily protein [Tautonia marina]